MKIKYIGKKEWKRWKDGKLETIKEGTIFEDVKENKKLYFNREDYEILNKKIKGEE